MPGLVIPIDPSRVHWVQRTAIDGIDYLLEFKWNERMERWTMNMMFEDGTPLRNGITVNCDVPLFRSRIDGMPAGEMVCIDLTRRRDPPTLTDFGKRCILKYYTQEQVLALSPDEEAG